MYKFTEEGMKKAEAYLAELKAKRKEILDANLDTINGSDCANVTVDDLLEDAIDTGFDDDGEAINGYFVTDNYDSDNPYCFKLGEDIIEVKSRDLVAENADFTTTFAMDFAIADRFGLDAIRDTFNRAFKEWKCDYRYLTDLVMVLNHQIFNWYEKNKAYAELYNELWEKADYYACENLQGDELDYFYRITD